METPQQFFDALVRRIPGVLVLTVHDVTNSGQQTAPQEVLRSTSPAYLLDDEGAGRLEKLSGVFSMSSDYVRALCAVVLGFNLHSFPHLLVSHLWFRPAPRFSLGVGLVFIFPARVRLPSLTGAFWLQASKLQMGRNKSIMTFFNDCVVAHFNFSPLVVTLLGSADANVGAFSRFQGEIEEVLSALRTAAEDR
jgi:Mitogen-activated protein kinase kinase 1 interacting